MTHSFAGLNGIFNPASKHAAQAIKLFKDVFDNENRLRKLFDEGKISESEFLERRVKEVKPYMDNLHAWLLEKKQKEMILDTSKTKAVMEQEHPALLRVYYKPLKRRSQGCKRKRALTRRILSLIEMPIRIF